MPAQTVMKGARDVVPSGGRGPQDGKYGTPKPPKRAKAPVWAKLLTSFGVVLTLLSAGGLVTAS